MSQAHYLHPYERNETRQAIQVLADAIGAGQYMSMSELECFVVAADELRQAAVDALTVAKSEMLV